MQRTELEVVAGDDERFVFRIGMTPMPTSAAAISFKCQVRRTQDFEGIHITDAAITNVVLLDGVVEVDVLFDKIATRVISKVMGDIPAWWDLQFTDEVGERQTIIGGWIVVEKDVTA